MAGADITKAIQAIENYAARPAATAGNQTVVDAATQYANLVEIAVTVHSIDSPYPIRHHRAMARLARVVVPGLPHHVTQRGNGRARVFFSDADYALYRDLLAASCRNAGVEVWAWCLMPNHVHLSS